VEWPASHKQHKLSSHAQKSFATPLLMSKDALLGILYSKGTEVSFGVDYPHGRLHKAMKKAATECRFVTWSNNTAKKLLLEQAIIQLSTAWQCSILSYLGSNAYAPWMLVIQQQPFRPEPGVIWVVTLCCHVCGVTHHVQRDYVQQGMTGCMETISERQASVLDTLACCPWNPDIRSLKNSRHAQVLLISGCHWYGVI